LHCIVLYCTVWSDLYCVALNCTLLYYTILHCTILYYTVLYYTTLYYTILHCTILYYTVLYYTALYYTILFCTVLDYFVLCCTVQYLAGFNRDIICSLISRWDTPYNIMTFTMPPRHPLLILTPLPLSVRPSLPPLPLSPSRCIVGDMPGLTRDSIHVEWAYKDRNFRYTVRATQH
jgi:hypothetical protein